MRLEIHPLTWYLVPEKFDFSESYKDDPVIQIYYEKLYRFPCFTLVRYK